MNKDNNNAIAGGLCLILVCCFLLACGFIVLTGGTQ